MRTKSSKSKLSIAGIAAIFFMLLIGSLPVKAQVQPYEDEGLYTAPTAPEFCDPVPEDIALLENCTSYWGSGGQANIYREVSTETPVVGTGAFGMSSAYNPTDGTILFVSTNASATSILGRVYNATSMQPVSEQVVIDQGSLDSSSPLAVYNPEVNAYLVVWQDERPTTNRSSIYGRKVEANGSFVGPDFPIVNDINVRLGDLVLDQKNSRYAVNYDHIPSGPGVKFVDYGGTVQPSANLGVQTGSYLSESSMTYNSNTNEYWVVYKWVAGNEGLWSQDERIMFRRIDATTLQPVGEPVQLSYNRPSMGLQESPQIAYSAEDGAALVVWRENLRLQAGSHEIYGRTIYDSGTISTEHEILTHNTYNGGMNYGLPSNFIYNSYTNTFALTIDNGSGTTYVEMLSDGTVVEAKEVLEPSETETNSNSGVAATNTGFVSYASVNNAAAVTAPVSSVFRASGSVNAQPSGSIQPISVVSNTQGFAETLSKIYLYALGLSGILAVAMSVYGGYVIMTARGNGAQVGSGKEYIVSSLIGMVLLMLSFLILNTINPDLTNFKVTDLTF